MSLRQKCVLASIGLILIGASPVWSQGLLQTLDPDKDGTVDLAEANDAASKLFDKLDRDHDGTLDKRELGGRINGSDFAAADPDNDGTLDKNEFLAIVEKRYGQDEHRPGNGDCGYGGHCGQNNAVTHLSSPHGGGQHVWALSFKAAAIVRRCVPRDPWRKLPRRSSSRTVNGFRPADLGKVAIPCST
jgi:hypothetical protein